MRRVEIGIIGDIDVRLPIKNVENKRVGTPYGPSNNISIGGINGKNIAFLHRQNETSIVPSHKINYRANIWALHFLGVKRIISTSYVNSLKQDYCIGDLVIPCDFIDFTKSRLSTFYDTSPMTNINMNIPYCPNLRKKLIQVSNQKNRNVWDNAIFVCTEGPRYETPAEIKMFKILGCDVIGKTGLPEAVLAREMEICFASLFYVTNLASGLIDQKTVEEASEEKIKIIPVVREVLTEVIPKISTRRNCICSHALEGARF